MSITKNFYFKEQNKYTLSDGLALEIANSQLRMTDLGEFYSDSVTIILTHFNETSGLTCLNSANYCTPEIITYLGNPWSKLVDPRLVAGSNYKLRYFVSDGSAVFGKHDCNGNSLLALYNGSDANADYALGSTIATMGGVGAVVSGNYLHCNNTGSARYSITKNANFTQVGTIRFLTIPLYSGTPAAKEPLVSIPGSTGNGVYLYHENITGNLVLRLVDSSGTAHTTDFGVWNPVSGDPYVFTLQIDCTTGNTKLYIGLAQKGSTWTQICTRTTTGLTTINVGDLADFDPAAYYNGDFGWVSFHRNYTALPSIIEPADFSPSGSLTVLSSMEHKLYYDIDEELLSGETGSVVLEITDTLPVADLDTNITVTNVSTSSAGFTNAILGMDGLFNKTCYGFNGSTSYVRMSHSTAMDITDDTPMSVDASFYFDELGAVYDQKYIVGNIDLTNNLGWCLTINGDGSKIYFYKNSFDEYIVAQIPAGTVKANTFYRISVEYDPTKGLVFDDMDQPIKVYINKQLLPIMYGDVSPLQNITGISILGCTTVGVADRVLQYTITFGTKYLQFDGGILTDITSVSAGDVITVPSATSGYLIVEVTDPTLLPLNTRTDTLTINKYFDDVTFKSSTRDYYIGALEGSSLFYKGRLDEIRISRGTRSLSEITNEHYTVGTFYTDVNVTFTPGNLLGWSGFSESISPSLPPEILTNNGQIKYQFSNNNGASYIYYNTGTHIWTASGSLTDANTLAELTPAVMQSLTLATNTSLKVRIIFTIPAYNDYTALNYYNYVYESSPIIDTYKSSTYELETATNTRAYSSGSRYSRASAYKYDPYTVIDGRSIPTMRPDPTDGFYTVKAVDNGRLDIISLNVYGTIEYWWVLADVNDIFNPFAPVVLGSVIRIPTRSRIGSL